jgi:hypothetical protein
MPRPKHQQGRHDERVRLKDSAVGMKTRRSERIGTVLRMADYRPKCKKKNHRWEDISATHQACMKCPALRETPPKEQAPEPKPVHQTPPTPGSKNSRNTKRKVYEEMMRARQLGEDTHDARQSGG